jgi:hypothetical protein
MTVESYQFIVWRDDLEWVLAGAKNALVVAAFGNFIDTVPFTTWWPTPTIDQVSPPPIFVSMCLSIVSLDSIEA